MISYIRGTLVDCEEDKDVYKRQVHGLWQPIM